MTRAEIDALLAHLANIWDTADNQPRPTWDPSQEWGDHWAEQRADERRMPHTDPREDDRAADNYYEKRWGA